MSQRLLNVKGKMIMKKAAYISATILEVLCLAGPGPYSSLPAQKWEWPGMLYIKTGDGSPDIPWNCWQRGRACDGPPDRHAFSLFPAPEKESDKSTVGCERRYGASDIRVCGIYMDEFRRRVSGLLFYQPNIGDCVPDTVCQSMDWNVGVQEWMTGPGFGIKKE